MASETPKHRACDECRTRKLACSKELEGCSRCVREGIRCVYSPQKTMGRPRKRRIVEDESSQPQAAPDTEAVATTFISHEQPSLSSQWAPAVVDPSLDFLDDQSSNIGLWDLPSEDYPSLDMTTKTALLESSASQTLSPSLVPNFALSGVDLLSGINFDEPDHSQTVVNDHLAHTLHRILENNCTVPSDQAPSSSSSSSGASPGASASSPGTDSCNDTDRNSTPPRAIPSVNCSCLSSLYLAMDSLSRLPTDVIPAMKVARNASRVAHDVIHCPQCGVVPRDPIAPVPIQSFQNLMFLGALVPSACNAYAAILDMVDSTAAAYKRDGRVLWFSFANVGGLWGQVGKSGTNCHIVQSYDNREMDPDLWRVTIRALLRLDIYGLDGAGSVVDEGFAHDPTRPTHMGLKGVVDMLDERTRKRHEILDKECDNPDGSRKLIQHAGVFARAKPVPPAERNCTQIVETARTALENLIII